MLTQYPNWSRITHLPLPMKLFILKILGQQGINVYMLLEKRVIGELAEVETALLEPIIHVDQDDTEEDFESDSDSDSDSEDSL
jgi:hypothetical protein